MQHDKTLDDLSINIDSDVSDEQLHAQARKCIAQFNQLITDELPSVLSKIIKQQVWQKRPASHQNFGDYALDNSLDGLAVSNNEMLWALGRTVNTEASHVSHWGDVLTAVEKNVRVYAKKNKIAVKDLNKELYQKTDIHQEDAITYIPSRSKSLDGQLLKLKIKDPEAYENVIHGKVDIKDTLDKAPRKRLDPIDSMKTKFANLSKADRLAFLEWLEHEKEQLESVSD